MIGAMPERIQQRRVRGWRMPAGARSVARPSRWGNPWEVRAVRFALGDSLSFASIGCSPLYSGACFPRPPALSVYAAPEIEALAQRVAVDLFALAARRFQGYDPAGFEAWIAPLVGLDLACWCPLGLPCHGDVLLALADEMRRTA